MKRLLVVAYYFPPSSVTGTHRTLGFVKYLAQEGWHSSILCARNPIDPMQDPSLLSKVPPGTHVTRTMDFNLLAWRERLLKPWNGDANDEQETASAAPPPDAWTGWRAVKRYLAFRLRVPDNYGGWYLHTLWAGCRILRNTRIDALYSSGPPWTGHLIALRLARRFGVPWVADFRDPWVFHPCVDIPFETLRRRNEAAEARTVQNADAIVCVLETMRQDFLTRYPSRSAEDVLTIPNGFDPQDFTDLPAEPDGSLTIMHAGTLYGRRSIQPLLSALREWRRSEPQASAPLRIQFLGGSHAEVDTVRRTIEKWEVQTCVRAEPDVPHREALKRLSRSTVLLLIGFTGSGAQFQMTGKIFEYLAVKRPILALAPPSCPIGDVLRKTGVRHWIVSPDDLPGVLAALTDIVRQWKDGNLRGTEDSRLEAFDRRGHARQLGRLLDRVISARRPEASPCLE